MGRTAPGSKVRLTVQLLLDLQGDGLTSHLQEVDGLTQRPALEANAVDGQDTVPNVDRASPGEEAQGRGYELDTRGFRVRGCPGETRSPKAHAWLWPRVNRAAKSRQVRLRVALTEV